MCALRADLADWLKTLWTDPSSPCAFSRPYVLYKEAKKRNLPVTLKQVKTFLKSQKTFTTHVPVRIRFPRASLIAYSIDFSWQADTAYMDIFWRRNSGFRFLLGVTFWPVHFLVLT